MWLVWIDLCRCAAAWVTGNGGGGHLISSMWQITGPRRLLGSTAAPRRNFLPAHRACMLNDLFSTSDISAIIWRNSRLLDLESLRILMIDRRIFFRQFLYHFSRNPADLIRSYRLWSMIGALVRVCVRVCLRVCLTECAFASVTF